MPRTLRDPLLREGGGPPARDAPAAETERRAYAAAIAVCAANVLAYFAIGVVAPVLPNYMRAVLGAGDVAVGIVMASYAVTTLVGRPAGGLCGDRVGYRLPAATGAILIVTGTAAYGLARSAAWLLLCRLVVGLGEGLSQSACIAWAVALAPARNRAALLSYAGVSGWAGVALGAMVGDAIVERGGYGAAFWAGAAAPAAGLAILAVAPGARAGSPARLSIAHLAVALARPGAAYALVTVGYAAVITFGPLFMRASGAAPAFLLHSFIGGVVAVRIVAAHLPARLGPTRTACLCATAQAIGFLVVAALPSHLAVVVTGGIVAGMAFGLSFPSLALYALGRVSDGDRGLAIGVVSAFFDVGMALSGVVLGWMTQREGYPAAFAFAGGCAAVAAVVLQRRGP